MALLEAVGLVKRYGSRTVVDGVSFTVNAGEVVGLLGPNGAGKTTSFSMTCGTVTPTAGRVLLHGHDVTDWPMYRRAQLGMGYLPQQRSLFVQLTVEENILAVLEMIGVKRSERARTTGELLEQFGLLEKKHQLPATLSGGEARRLEIARCLVTQPTLILLDEPFTGIDPVTIHGIQDVIRDLANRGIAILLTDHRETETLSITDRNYIVCAGRVIVEGDRDTVLNDEEARRLYFGTRFNVAGAIGQAA
jgi:lipopolysaccharide export system ATP-binding protein